MRPLNRVSKPSKRSTLITVLLIGTILSAYFLGSNISKDEGVNFLSSSGQMYEIVPESRGEMSTSEAQAAAETAVMAASDSAKSAASGLVNPLSIVFRPSDVGQEIEISAEPAEVIFERMVIFTARLRLEVEEVDLTVYEIRLIAEDSGGFVTGMSTSRSEWGVMTLRVPQDEFYDVIQEIEDLGEVEERELKGEDITENYIDLEAQLVNLEKEEERLVEILDMARNVEEVLKVENQLSRVRGKIESITGEMKYLEGRVELATITVTFREEFAEEITVLPKVDWWAPVSTGLEALTTVVQGMLAMAVFLGPFLIVGFSAYRLYKRGFGAKDLSPESASP